LLWQHNPNPSYKLASIPRYDDSANGRLGGGLRAPPAGDRRATGGAPKTARRMREAGAAAADGERSQHYCGSLVCGLPLVAFWQQKVNAKC